MVNQTFAHRAWSDRDPIGATIIRSASGDARRGVGVAADTRSLGRDLKIRPELYVPFAQDAQPSLYIILRTTDPFDTRLPAEIRAAAAGLDS